MSIRVDANRPYSYNTRWRLKFNRVRLTTFVGYRKGDSVAFPVPYDSDTTPFNHAYFWHLKENFTYDEYDHRWYNESNALITGTRTIPFHEIPAVAISHEIGNGENDYIGQRLVLDAQMDYRHFTGYTYEDPDGIPTNLDVWRGQWHDPQFVRRDPEVILDLRNQTLRPVVSYPAAPIETKYVDIVARNMAAKGGLNPFETTTQPINGTFPEDTGDINTARESMAFVCPFTKFRHARIELRTSHKMSMVRNLTWELTDFQRRTFG